MEMKCKALRCDICGKFVSYEDLEKDSAIHRLVTFDTESTAEKYETLCKKHKGE